MSPSTPSLKNYFLNYFEFNLLSNCVLLKKIEELPDPTKSLSMFTELITAHRRWLRCLTSTGCMQETVTMRNAKELKTLWRQSVNEWTDYITALDVSKMQSQLLIVCMENGETISTTVRDIAFQLNSQSVLMREQIVRLMRLQGCTPPHTDCVFSAIEGTKPVRVLECAR